MVRLLEECCDRAFDGQAAAAGPTSHRGPSSPSSAAGGFAAAAARLAVRHACATATAGVGDGARSAVDVADATMRREPDDIGSLAERSVATTAPRHPPPVPPYAPEL